MPSRPSDTFGLSMRGMDVEGGKPEPAGRENAPCSLDRPVKLRITCMNLRHKLMYVDERHSQRGMVDVNSDTRVFWCAKTQDPLGPDKQSVGPDTCSNGRNCYCHGG